jgi:hypothetical protein
VAKSSRPRKNVPARKTSREQKPRNDRANKALLLATEAILDTFFDDPDNQALYERLAHGKVAARAKPDEGTELGSMELPDDGEARLDMRVGAPGISVTVFHPDFQAIIAALYSVDTATMFDAQVLAFEGDREQARVVADRWCDEIDELGLDDQEFLAGLLPGGIMPYANDDDPGEPPPPSAADKMAVEHLAALLTHEMKQRRPDFHAHDDGLLALEGTPQALWLILDGVIAACCAHPRDDASVEAWLRLLERQLTSIRYRIERGWAWASGMADEFKRKLTGIGESGQVPPEDFARIAVTLSKAGIDVDQETRIALADVGLNMPPRDFAQMRGDLHELMEQMASLSETAFDATAGMNEATQIMPSELRCYLAHEFAHSPHAVLRDTLPMLLLADDQEVRRAAAAALEQTAAPDTMSPETLRRMIAVRNWLPEADRAGVDRAIRQARVKNVECAAWPPAQDMSIMASTLDGLGAQSIVLSSPGRKKGIVAGLLLKRGFGVADSWCHIETPRREMSDMLSTMRRETAACEIDRGCLDLAVQHALATNTAKGQPPGTDVLRIAELIGAADWRDRELDIGAEARRLFDALPEDQRSPAAIEASLRRSGDWINTALGDTWFLDEPEVRSIVKQGGRSGDQAEHRLMTEVMPGQRGMWAELFVLHALRARAAKDLAQHAQVADFAILAHCLCGDRELKDIPLIVASARRTIKVLRTASW